MYLIYSHNLETNEIIPRAKYSNRKAARINLLKEAQQWLLQYKTYDGEWELIAHKFQIKTINSKFYIKRNDKNEDLLSIYETTEVIQAGYIWNTIEKKLKKIIVFSVMEIPVDEQVSSSSYIVPTSTEKNDPKLRQAIDSKRKMIAEITQVLSKRRAQIE